ncbi:MAG: hypothetical protein MUC60_02800 [Oscillatoria sp. Prado101]|nr:hypothetical protein [Oscillatoria sp. Prado101]
MIAPVPPAAAGETAPNLRLLSFDSPSCLSSKLQSGVSKLPQQDSRGTAVAEAHFQAAQRYRGCSAHRGGTPTPPPGGIYYSCSCRLPH